MSQRPWYLPHWLSCVAGLLVVASTIVIVDAWLQGDGGLYVCQGWPFVVHEHRLNKYGARQPAMWPHGDPYYRELFSRLADLGIGFLVALSTAWTTEHWLRSRVNKSRFTRKSLLLIVAVTCAVLVFVYLEPGLYDRNHNLVSPLHVFDGSTTAEAMRPGTMLTRYPRFAAVPFLIGVGCTFYNAGWLAARLVRHIRKPALQRGEGLFSRFKRTLRTTVSSILHSGSAHTSDVPVYLPHGWHWLSWAVTCLVATALYYVEIGPFDGLLAGIGWPLLAIERPGHVRLLPTAFDLALCTVMIGSTGVAMERLARAKRVSLLSLVGVIASVCLLFAVLRAEMEYFEREFDPHFEFYRWSRFMTRWQHCILFRYPSILGVPVAFGLGCTIHTVGWLTLRFIGQVRKTASLSKPRASPPTSKA